MEKHFSNLTFAINGEPFNVNFTAVPSFDVDSFDIEVENLEVRSEAGYAVTDNNVCKAINEAIVEDDSVRAAVARHIREYGAGLAVDNILDNGAFSDCKFLPQCDYKEAV